MALATLKEDPELEKKRFDLVPKKYVLLRWFYQYDLNERTILMADVLD